MNSKELADILHELAEKDLADGADIFGHPCMIAIRMIRDLSLEVNLLGASLQRALTEKGLAEKRRKTLIFHSRQEGEESRPGFNYTKTPSGHGLYLFFPLSKSYRVMVGYHWGVKLKGRARIWNQTKADQWMHNMRNRNDDL